MGDGYQPSRRCYSENALPFATSALVVFIGIRLMSY